MSKNALDPSSGSPAPEATLPSSTALSADVVAGVESYLRDRAITDAFGSLVFCEAAEGKNSRSNVLLGTNAEILIVSYNQDGTWYSLVGDKDFQLPKDIMIRGRNVLVSYFWDGSVRLEPIDILKEVNPEDGFRGNSTRLDRSEMTLNLKGEVDINYTVILDGRGNVLAEPRKQK